MKKKKTRENEFIEWIMRQEPKEVVDMSKASFYADSGNDCGCLMVKYARQYDESNTFKTIACSWMSVFLYQDTGASYYSSNEADCRIEFDFDIEDFVEKYGFDMDSSFTFEELQNNILEKRK